MEGAASVYGGVGDIQERENNQMVSVLSQAKDLDLTNPENAAKLTTLLGRVACWDREVHRRIDAKHAEGVDPPPTPSNMQLMRDTRLANRKATSERLLTKKRASVAKNNAKTKAGAQDADPNPVRGYSKVSVGGLSIEHTTIDKREKFSPHGRGPPSKKGKSLMSVEAVSSANDREKTTRGAPADFRLHDGLTSKLLELGALVLGRVFIDMDSLIDAVNKEESSLFDAPNMLGLEDDRELTLQNVLNKLHICRGCKSRAIMGEIGGTLSYREFGWIAQAAFKICDMSVEDGDVVLFRNFHNSLCDEAAILEEFDNEYERCDTVEGMFDPREYLEVIGLQDQDVLDLLQDHILDDADAYVKLEEVKMPLRVV